MDTVGPPARTGVRPRSGGCAALLRRERSDGSRSDGRRSGGAGSDRGARFDEATSEGALAKAWDAYSGAEDGRIRFVLRHPGRVLMAMLAILRLPVLTYRLGPDGPGRRAVLSVTRDRGLGPIRLASLGPAVLELPEEPGTYDVGRRRQTLRRKVRAAQKLGVTCRAVEDPQERRALLAAANAAEAEHPDPTYRIEDPDNDDLLDHDVWLLAEHAEQGPLLLAVAPVSGEVATLRYFRTLGWSEVHSEARWAATRELVETLVARGARVLVDTEHPGRQPVGLRHFQRMVGFRFARLRTVPRR